jgi:hypothetical protein
MKTVCVEHMTVNPLHLSSHRSHCVSNIGPPFSMTLYYLIPSFTFCLCGGGYVAKMSNI